VAVRSKASGRRTATRVWGEAGGVIRQQQRRRRPRQSAGEAAGVNRRQRTKTSRLVRRHFNAHICSSTNFGSRNFSSRNFFLEPDNFFRDSLTSLFASHEHGSFGTAASVVFPKTLWCKTLSVDFIVIFVTFCIPWCGTADAVGWMKICVVRGTWRIIWMITWETALTHHYVSMLKSVYHLQDLVSLSKCIWISAHLYVCLLTKDYVPSKRLVWHKTGLQWNSKSLN